MPTKMIRIDQSDSAFKDLVEDESLLGSLHGESMTDEELRALPKTAKIVWGRRTKGFGKGLSEGEKPGLSNFGFVKKNGKTEARVNMKNRFGKWRIGKSKEDQGKDLEDEWVQKYLIVD